MSRRAISGIMLTLLLMSMLTVSLHIQIVKAESIETIIHKIVWEEQTFYVVSTSNSSVTPVPMIFDQPQKMLTFNATGPVGTTGFCDVTIPRELLDAIPWEWRGAWAVSVNATHQFLRVTYSHPLKEVKIIGTWAIGTSPTARTWTVDDDGPADFHTIQEAVNTAHGGDTIYVYNGTYREHVIVTKPLELLGEDKNTTVIDGGVSISQWISNVVISGFTIQNGGDGISLPIWSVNHLISNNIITKNGYGITGNYMCRKVIVSDNIITSNHYSGIWLGFAHGIIDGNTISNHGMFSGIDIVEGGNDNTIADNMIANNSIGICVTRYAERNIIYHNKFINNTHQVNIPPYLNISTFTWDNGYPSGGNYWSDYVGNDTYSGPSQNLTYSDGIGDIPYVIDHNNQDRYPFMNPWGHPIRGDINRDGKVNIRDIAIAAFTFGSCPGHPRWNSIADVNQDNKVNIRDIAIIAENFGKTHP